MKDKNYFVLAFYLFQTIEDPHGEVARHKAFFEGKDVLSRIYISEEGINGQMSAYIDDAKHYIAWMEERFGPIDFKIHRHFEHAFPKLTVKYRKQLVALDAKVDMALTGEHVSPQVWRQMLEQKDENTIILDVRNDYEWEVGHFEGAELPTLGTFRKFPEYAKNLKHSKDPKNTRVMMYCTGGIRCELYSALLKEEGFENVYQLQGGVINYGLQEGSDHWRGKLFVFDDRLAVPISENQPAEVISHCHHCETPSDVYYNCANMDCNALFLCCPDCAEKTLGCCCKECESAPRRRRFKKEKHPKPFRKYRASPESALESDLERR